jgi:hypothetical protein
MMIDSDRLLPRQGWVYRRGPRSLTTVYVGAHPELSSHRLIRRKERARAGFVVLAKLISIHGHAREAPVASSPGKMKIRGTQSDGIDLLK